MTDPRDLEDDEPAAGLTPLTATVPLSAAGLRFDAALAALFPDYSRSRLSDWIKRGEVTLDGQMVKPRERVRGGEVVLVSIPQDIETHAEPEPIPLEILHADADVIVLNKPAGLVVHPGAGNPRGTLVNALLAFDPALAALPRAGIVHRLDKDTSGLMVVARSLRAHTALVEQLSNRAVRRQYAAVVVGAMVAGGTVDAPIGRHPHDRIRQAVTAGGREAVTHYRTREKFRMHTLVECRLETGRTHQIRVHMAHVKYPLVGDPLYGGALRLPKGATDTLVEVLRGFRRQALHAESLAFVHPATGETLAFEVPAPADFQQLVLALRDDTRSYNAK